MDYKSNNNVFYSCKYHVVWCPKYRRKVLVEEVERRLKELIYEAAAEINVDIDEGEHPGKYRIIVHSGGGILCAGSQSGSEGRTGTIRTYIIIVSAVSAVPQVLLPVLGGFL